MKPLLATLSATLLLLALYFIMPATPFQNAFVLSTADWIAADPKVPVRKVEAASSLTVRNVGPGGCCVGAYRFVVSGSSILERINNATEAGLYIPAIGGEFTVRLNDRPVNLPARDYSSTGPIIPLDRELLNAKALQIDIEMRGPEMGFVGLWKGPLLIADIYELQQFQTKDRLHQVIIPTFFAFAMFLLGGLFLYLYFKTRRLFIFYPLFSACLIICGIFSLYLAGIVRDFNFTLGSFTHYPVRILAAFGIFALQTSFLFWMSGDDKATMKKVRFNSFAIAFIALATLDFALVVFGQWNITLYVTAFSLPLAHWPLFYWDSRRFKVTSLEFLAYVVSVASLIGISLDAFKIAMRALGVGVPYGYFDRYITPLLLLMSLVVYVRHFSQFFDKYHEQIKLSASERAIARTVQTLAHDVRRPFSILKAGLNDLNRLKQTPAQLPASIERLSAETNRQLAHVDSMLEDILTIGSSAIHTSPHALHEEVTSALAYAAQARPRPDLRTDIKIATDLFVNVDQGKFSRVLVNLLDNALQATEPNGKLWITALSSSRGDKNLVELSIGNSGSYITPADIGLIFEPFFTKNKKDGTGLGLAIVRKIVMLHGGEISCRSSQIKGTEFLLTLPLVSSVPKDLTTDNLSRATSIPTTIKSVAVIEDNAFLRDAWKAQLKAEAEVYCFASPEEFLAWSEPSSTKVMSLDVVITDYHFDEHSKMTGDDLARALRAQGYKGPILLASDSLDSAGNRTLFTAQIPKEPMAWEALRRQAQDHIS